MCFTLIYLGFDTPHEYHFDPMVESDDISIRDINIHLFNVRIAFAEKYAMIIDAYQNSNLRSNSFNFLTAASTKSKNSSFVD